MQSGLSIQSEKEVPIAPISSLHIREERELLAFALFLFAQTAKISPVLEKLHRLHSSVGWDEEAQADEARKQAQAQEDRTKCLSCFQLWNKLTRSP